MALPILDTFDGSSGDLLAHVGQVGAAWARHPTSVYDPLATANNLWSISHLGSTYCGVDAYQNVAKNNHAFYLASGVPPAVDYDLVAEFHIYTKPGDQGYGVAFDFNATANTGWRLSYGTFATRWELGINVAGDYTSLATFVDNVPNGTVRSIRIKRRTSGANTSVAVHIDGSGTASLTAVNSIVSGGVRVGLYGQGVTQSTATTGVHIDRLAVGDVDFALPDYSLSGPAASPPLAESSLFTVTLEPSVNPGAITITPAVVGLAGTFTPTTVALSNTTRSATFTFTPNVAGGAGTISVTDSSTLVDPPSMAFTSDLSPPVRLAAWESQLHWPHTTGASPYMAGAGSYLEGPEHWDVINAILSARDYCVRNSLAPTDWSDQVAAGLDRYRDYVITVGSVQNWHINTVGLARHWYETGDPLDRAAIDILFASPYIVDAARLVVEYSQLTHTRPIGFFLLSALDREASGMGEHPLTDACVTCLLAHVNQWTLHYDNGTRYGVWCKAFMTALALRAMIAYWDRYRDATEPTRAANVAAIPAAVKATLQFVWDTVWYQVGVDADMGGGLGIWDRGAVKYITPATDDASMLPITGLTIQTVTDDLTFTGPASLSTIDDYYLYATLAWTAPSVDDGSLVVGYEGATRTFHLNPYYHPGTRTVGAGFELSPSTPGESGIGPLASPALNQMIAPAFAWAYWHTKVVLADTAGAIGYRVKHDAMFDGGSMSWGPPADQKQWNESLYWTTMGLDWRSRGDSEWPAATAVTLEAPATGVAGAVSVESGTFRLSVPHGVSLAAPESLNPACSTGLGTFSPDSPLVVLTTDRPWAGFTFTPALADDAKHVNITAAPATLTADAPVTYTVGSPALPAAILLVNSPAGGVLMYVQEAP